MKEFYIVMPEESHGVDPLTERHYRKFDTFDEAREFAQGKVIYGKGSLYILKTVHRVYLPVEEESASDTP